MKDTKKAAKKTTARDEAAEGFTPEEREAMKERAKEVKAARRGQRGSAADAEGALLEKIAEMPESDRVMAERIHAIVKANAPELSPKLWYGMPAYARDGKVVCFFQSAQKFKSRYATLGFNDDAHLDEDSMWPTAFALTKLTAANEARIGELVKKAAG
ncbi:iron chaperone [Phytohabitans kaempferiae]|uniref:Iron chaperone n=1 Tax=Phytohabitans kaempferiae TaxID=1620943 RepID=A0ABV6LZ88_9ACTN